MVRREGVRQLNDDELGCSEFPVERLARVERELERQVAAMGRLTEEVARHGAALQGLQQSVQGGGTSGEDERRRVEAVEVLARRRALPRVVTDTFDHLTSVEAVDAHVRWCYAHLSTDGSRLPAAVDEPGPLMAHVVRLAGRGGITHERLLEVFEPLDADRMKQGLKVMCHDGGVVEVTEERLEGATGRLLEATVYRAA